MLFVKKKIKVNKHDRVIFSIPPTNLSKLLGNCSLPNQYNTILNLHFKIKPVVTAQLSKWTSEQLIEVIARLIATEIQMKTRGTVNPSTLTGQTLLGIVLRSRKLNR